MADILHVDFAKRSRTYTREPTPVDPFDPMTYAFPLGLDTPVEELLLYESSLGYSSDTAPCEYVAPEGDPA